MAVPTNARILRGAPLKSGVILGVSPSSDPTFDVEIARATSSGVYDSVGRLTPKGGGVPVSFTDLLPLDNATRYYKARAVKDGWDPGDYTSPVSGKPVPLPEILPNITPVTGRPLGVSVFISTGAPTAYGSPASTGAFGKTLYAAGMDFTGITNAVPYRGGANFGSLRPTTGNASTEFAYVTNIKVPIGVTVDRVSLTYRRGSTVSVVGVRLDQITTTGGAVTQYQKYSTSVSASRQVLSSSSFSFVTALNYVTIACALRNQVVDSSTAIELSEASIRYRIPNLNKTI